MAGIERKQAKTINLGLMYGMGKNKLMAELGLMKDSAEKLIQQYHHKAPFVKKLMDNVSRKANDRGKIRTLLVEHVILIYGNQFNLGYSNHCH